MAHHQTKANSASAQSEENSVHNDYTHQILSPEK